MEAVNQDQGAVEAAPLGRGLVEGFDYTRGVKVIRTLTEWRAILLTHDRRVENGETYFVNKQTKRIDHEAYANIKV